MTRLTILFLLLSCYTVKGQLIRTSSPKDSIALINFIPKGGLKRDSSELSRQSRVMLTKLYSNGYLAAGFSIIKQDSSHIVDWALGYQYMWANLSAGNLSEYLISKIGYKSKFYRNELFNISEFKKLFNAIIKESDNNGRPFAYVSLDSLKVEGNKIEAVIYYEPGPEITFDQLQIIGTDRISTSWLEAYLNVREGTLYNQEAINEIKAKIDALSFVSLVEDPSITFQNLSSEVKLNLRYEKSNSLDGIVGFLPNEQADGELLITGQLFLGLTNLFNTGKDLILEWQSLKARSQLLNLTYRHPNILKSPIDVAADFSLLKEDTSFINREFQLSSVYRKIKSEFSLFYRARGSSILSELENQEDITDFTINYYGAGYQYSSRRDKTGNINRFDLSIESAVGSKSEELAFSDSVESVLGKLTSIQYQAETQISNQFKLSRLFNLFVGAQGGFLFNENELYRNDLFRVGGLKTIRGFNENYFFTDMYALIKSEIRLYYQPESFLFLFYDQSFLQYNVLGNSLSDNPLGLGLGMELKVNGGVLNMAYGLGKAADQDIDFRLSKFHFGYVARF